jgi:hypothetical protein
MVLPYLKLYEEDVVVKFLVQMSNLRQPIRMKFVPSIAFSVTRQRPAVERPLKAPGKNWTKALEKRHLTLTARRLSDKSFPEQWNSPPTETFLIISSEWRLYLDDLP